MFTLIGAKYSNNHSSIFPAKYPRDPHIYINQSERLVKKDPGRVYDQSNLCRPA